MTDYTMLIRLTDSLYWVIHKHWYNAPDDVRLSTMLEF